MPGSAGAPSAGAGLWWAVRPRSDPRFDALMQRGLEALRLDEPGSSKYFDRAVAVEPRNAKAWGLLAYSLAQGVGDGPRDLTGPTALATERAARTALQIDRNEPDALLAMALCRAT
jgi:hypothetical protein